MVNYQEGLIYKIAHRYSPYVYIGSTTNFDHDSTMTRTMPPFSAVSQIFGGTPPHGKFAIVFYFEGVPVQMGVCIPNGASRTHISSIS